MDRQAWAGRHLPPKRIAMGVAVRDRKKAQSTPFYCHN
jgi:hypothetical protein